MKAGRAGASAVDLFDGQSVRRWAWTFAAIGIAVPLLYFIIFFAGRTQISNWTPWVALWPTSLLLLGTAGHEHSAGAAVVIILSIAMNAVMYAVLGAGLARLWARVRGQ